MRVFVVLCVAGLMGGCVTPAGNLTVQPLDKPEFRAMTAALRPQLIRKGLLTDDGAWYAPVLSRAGMGFGPAKNAGAVLLDRLSPAFRFPGAAPSLPFASFRDMLTDEATVTVTGHAFTVLQGVDRLHVSLLALTDWNRDGRDDWLVLCRVEPRNQKDTRRDYYLLIADPAAPVLVPQVLAVRDCVNGRCRVVETADAPGLAPDSPAVELMQGQQAVTQPPSDAPAESPDGPVQTPLAQ